MLRACAKISVIPKACEGRIYNKNQIRGWRSSICGVDQKLPRGSKPRCLKCGRTDCKCSCIPCPTCGRADPCKCPAICDRSNVGPIGLEGPSSRWGDHEPGEYKQSKRIFFFFLAPLVGAVMLWVYFTHEEVDRSWLGRYTPFEHMYIHTKRYPWGDGKRSLFHNPRVNAIPGEGYEDDAKCNASSNER